LASDTLHNGDLMDSTSVKHMKASFAQLHKLISLILVKQQFCFSFF